MLTVVNPTVRSAQDNAIATMLQRLDEWGDSAVQKLLNVPLPALSFLRAALDAVNPSSDAETEGAGWHDSRTVASVAIALIALHSWSDARAFEDSGGARFFAELASDTEPPHGTVARIAARLLLYRERTTRPTEYRRNLGLVLRQAQLRCDTSLLSCPSKLYCSYMACTPPVGFTDQLHSGLAASINAYCNCNCNHERA